MTHELFNTAVAACKKVMSDFGTAYRTYMVNKPRPKRQTVG
jgi:hypothetical protein